MVFLDPANSYPRFGSKKAWAAHYELREFSSSIAYFWLEWLGALSICKQKFTKHIMKITQSNQNVIRLAMNSASEALFRNFITQIFRKSSLACNEQIGWETDISPGFYCSLRFGFLLPILNLTCLLTFNL